jgi:hypothetical protein
MSGIPPGIPPRRRLPLGGPGLGLPGQVQPPMPGAVPGAFKRGGRVKKTGMAKVHKGEKVLTAKQAKSMPAAKGKKTTAHKTARKRGR